MMSSHPLTIDLPDELLEMLGSPEAARAKTREALILQLLREGEVSQGRAARLLGVNRYELLDLMAKNQIPSGPQSPDEIRHEIEAALRLADEP